jgi:hypothetical protein
MTTATLPGLYHQLLGASWNDLGEAVRRLHAEGQTVQAAGRFQVRHGDNRLTRLLVRLAGLPAAGEAVDVRLAIIPLRQGETWSRKFAGRPLVSFQSKGPDGLLAESMGPLELQFRLEILGEALVYHPEKAALRLGPLRIPLPRWLAPRISARENPSGPNRTHVAVEVSLPVLGLLIAYNGTMTPLEVLR